MDAAGKTLGDEDDYYSYGLKLMGNYTLPTLTETYMAPGHNSVLRNPEGRWFLFCHIREKNFTESPEPSTMQVRQMFFTSDGWPVLCPEIYAGETEEALSEEELYGFYERIDFFAAYPQGISTALPMRLSKTRFGTPDEDAWGGSYEHGCLIGKWEALRDKKSRLVISGGSHTEEAVICRMWDRERECETIGISGINEDGIAFWAKKIQEAQESEKIPELV